MTRRYGAGTVYQRPDGKWSGQWSAGQDDSGNRVRGTVTADTEAAAWKAMAAARGKSSSTKRRRGGETVEAFLTRWLADVIRPTKRERTYWGYRSIVERELVPTFGETPLVKLTRREVQAWVNRQTCSPLTTRHRLDCLRGALSRAIRWGLIETNPAKEIDLPAVTRRTVRAMSPDDARALLACVEGTWFAPLVTVALYTGLRQGELLGLRWEDVNLGSHTRIAGSSDGAVLRGGVSRGTADEGSDEGRLALREGQASGRVEPAHDRASGGVVAQAVGGSLTVHNALARLPGKHGIRYVLDAPKSSRSRRTVPLAPPAVAALRSVKRAHLDGSGNEHNLVFARPDGRPIDGSGLTHAFQDALKAAELPRMTWHDLRHAWVSLMLDSGVSLIEVSQMAGHSGIGITSDIYAHLTTDKRAEAIETMARRIG